MSWYERDYNREGGSPGGRPGGDWSGMRPSFDNPASWSLPLARVWGISVRVHIILVLFIAFQLLESVGSPTRGVSLSLDLFFTSVWVGGLFFIVLLHEFGHCIACRRVRGEADEILMWPLGGLAFCHPPGHWKAHLWTVLGGPLVNVMLIPVLGIPLGIISGAWWGAAIPLPFGQAPAALSEVSDIVFALYILARVNMMLLLFNLLPMFPLDGGRIVQALLWPRLGYGRSMLYSVRVGYFGAIALGLYGAATAQWVLVGLAFFGGFTCYQTYRQLQYTDALLGPGYGGGYGADPEVRRGPSKRQLRKAQRERQQQEHDARELDRLLDKIREKGMASLSSSEQKWLRRHTEKQRRDGGT